MKLEYGVKLTIIRTTTSRSSFNNKAIHVYFLKETEDGNIWYCESLDFPKEAYKTHKSNICHIFDKEQ